MCCNKPLVCKLVTYCFVLALPILTFGLHHFSVRQMIIIGGSLGSIAYFIGFFADRIEILIVTHGVIYGAYHSVILAFIFTFVHKMSCQDYHILWYRDWFRQHPWSCSLSGGSLLQQAPRAGKLFVSGGLGLRRTCFTILVSLPLGRLRTSRYHAHFVRNPFQCSGSCLLADTAFLLSKSTGKGSEDQSTSSCTHQRGRFESFAHASWEDTFNIP